MLVAWAFTPRNPEHALALGLEGAIVVHASGARERVEHDALERGRDGRGRRALRREHHLELASERRVLGVRARAGEGLEEALGDGDLDAIVA